MKMTEQQFRDWASSVKFTSEAALDGETDTEKYAGDDEDGQAILAPAAFGIAWKAMTALVPPTLEKITVTYQSGVEWSGTTSRRFNDEYVAYDTEYAPSVIIEGVQLVDEDGDDIEEYEAHRVVREAVEGLEDIDFDALLPAIVTEDIDIDEEDTMETITLENDNAAAIRFTGEEIAVSSSSPDTSSSYHSGSVGRWTVLKLYKTKGGKFVCQSIGYTQWQGEHDRHKAQVCETEADVIAFFGHGWLAKSLYAEAGIEDTVYVE